MIFKLTRLVIERLQIFYNTKNLHLISIFALGIILRIPGLHLGLWRDEGSTYFDSIPDSVTEVINTVQYTELNPPLFYIIMHSWIKLLGSSDLVLKLPAFFFGILLIPSLYLLGKESGNRKSGIISAIIATFASTSVYYSQETRSYSLAALISCWIVIFFYRIYQQPKLSSFYLAGLLALTTILLYVQYTGFILILSLSLVTLFLYLSRKITLQKLWYLLISFLISIFLFIPWLPSFWAHFQTGTPWSEQRTVSTVFWGFYKSVFYTFFLPNESSVLKIWFVILFVSLVWSICHQKKRDYLSEENRSTSRDTNLIFLTCIICPAFCNSILSGAERYMFPFAPIAWVLYSHLIASINFKKMIQDNHQKPNLYFASIFFTIFLFFACNIGYACSFIGIDKSGIKKLSIDLRNDNPSQVIYLLSPDYLAPTFGYYFRDQPIKIHGFARWHHPEKFSPIGYAELWNNPSLMDNTELYIEDAIKMGYQQLVLIQRNKILTDEGKLRYSRANDLATRLSNLYPKLEQKRYFGRSEPIILYRYMLSPKTQSNSSNSMNVANL